MDWLGGKKNDGVVTNCYGKINRVLQKTGDVVTRRLWQKSMV